MSLTSGNRTQNNPKAGVILGICSYIASTDCWRMLDYSWWEHKGSCMLLCARVATKL